MVFERFVDFKEWMGYFEESVRESGDLEVEGIFFGKEGGKLGGEALDVEKDPKFVEKDGPRDGGEEEKSPENSFAKPVGLEIGVEKWIGGEKHSCIRLG